MGANAAWHTANTKAAGPDNDYANHAVEDRKKFDENADVIKNSGKFTAALAEDMKWCAFNMAWYHANTTFENDV